MKYKSNIKFPLAIKVNAWMALAYPLLLLIVLIMALFLNNSEYTSLVKNFIFDKGEPMLSWFMIFETIIIFILVWVMYINKKYVQYIVKVFYFDYFFNVLINIGALEKEPVSAGILILLEGLPVLWLYMSKDVQNFINSER